MDKLKADLAEKDAEIEQLKAMLVEKPKAPIEVFLPAKKTSWFGWIDSSIRWVRSVFFFSKIK
jgi:hypothetical protein